jgi:hypothetical protein
MKKFEDLPTEILSEIFSYFAWDKQQLRNLALQCHCFSLAVRPILLHNLVLHPNGRANTLKLVLLKRAVSENSSLVDLVRSLSLSWSESNIELHRAMESILGRLTALRVLKIQNNSDHACFKHDFLEVNPMDQLTQLTLSDTNLTIENMAPYMFLKNVVHLVVLWLLNPTPPTFDLLGWPESEWTSPRLPNNRQAGTSPVEFLDFGPIFHLPEPILKELLSWPKTLKRFRGTIPGNDLRGRFGVSKKMTTALSPASISRALGPAKHSLKHLELIDIGCEWPGHDETQMDLSDFKTLTTLNVPSTCFFKAYTYGVKREGFYALLPPSLVALQVSLGVISTQANAD